jgi:hypothetical protein
MKLPLANGKYRKPCHVVAGILGFFALAIWFSNVYIWLEYDRSRPLLPDASVGRVYPLNSHGHVVYLTQNENSRLTRLTILAVILFGIAVLIEGLFVNGFFRKVKPWEKNSGEFMGVAHCHGFLPSSIAGIVGDNRR